MSCGHAGDCSQLVVLVADAAGKTSTARLCHPRWWQVLGVTTGGYRVFVTYGDKTAQVDTLAGGLHSTAFVGMGADVFVSLDNMQPGATAFIGVSR
jgi:hypothetical protein